MAGTVPMLSVYPSRPLVTDKFNVVVENIPPGLPVTLHSLHYSEMEEYWEAFGHYVADDTGKVNVWEDASLGGTYTGKEAMGLIWSAKAVPGTRKYAWLNRRDVCNPEQWLISVYKGHLSEGFMQQPPLASVVTERWYMAPGVTRIEVQENELEACLFIPPGPGPFPAVFELWGMAQKPSECRPALLASKGFVVMVTNIIPPGKDYTLDFFLRAFQFLQEHPMVISSRVGLYGLSYGAILVLNMACRSDVINPRCCVSLSGACLLLDGTITQMVEHAYATKGDRIRLDEENFQITRGITVPLSKDEILHAENIKCPLMMVFGEDDQNFSASISADIVANIMHEAGNDHLLTTIRYPDTGHVITAPYNVTERRGFLYNPILHEKVLVLWGGQNKPHAFAQEDCWNKSLVFLRQHLYPGPHSVPNASL